jgi:hypothetical protein
MNPGVYPREPTRAQLLTASCRMLRSCCGRKWRWAIHELRLELRTIIRAVMSLGLGIGLAAIGGWLLILMLVHLLQALPVLPLWACYGLAGGCWQWVG